MLSVCSILETTVNQYTLRNTASEIGIPPSAGHILVFLWRLWGWGVKVKFQLISPISGYGVLSEVCFME